jgi:DNA-binding PadR family transcriptional regulator
VARTDDLQRLLPLKPVDLELLLALVDGERHGYGLVQRITERTGGIIRLEPGNLYRVIKRLLASGLVEESSRGPAPDLADERRRYYRLTPRGARLLRAEIHRLRSLLTSAPVQALGHWAGTS